MKLFRCTFSLLLALAIVFSMAPSAFAAEITEDDTYVLQRQGGTGEFAGPNMQYSSPHAADYVYNGENGRNYPALYTMYNSSSGEVIPTYCTDIMVTANPGTVYRRLNLEDSHFTGSAAGLIRAMVHKGFYIVPKSGESDADHKARVQEKLQAMGEATGLVDPETGVTTLSLGEALSGTQLAIWQAAHGSVLTYLTFVRDYPGKASSSAVRYADLCNEEFANLTIVSGKLTAESKAIVDAHIRAVYDYLLGLEPEAPTGKAVSPSSFTGLSDPVFTLNEDGTYDVSVTAKVKVTMAGGDSLTLEATLGDASASQALSNGQQTVTLTLADVPAESYGKDVTLSISGYQTVSDVFLFDAEGDREASQAMVGMDDSQLPVYASVKATQSRILNIQKTSRDSSHRPLEGIVFDVYPVATMEEYTSGEVVLPEPEDCPHSEELAEYTMITDENGYASMNFTQFGLPDGVYLVVEREHPAIVAPIDPFYVILPATNADGTGYEYEITAKPKNDVKGGVDIEKDVISLGNDSAAVDAGENHTWIISASIPDDIAEGKSYVITDTLDNRLDYAGNLTVTVESADGETLLATLAENTDYTLTVTDVDSLSEGKPSDSFKLELTETGMGKVAAGVGENSFSDCRIRVRYDAQINANAEMGQEIPNEADLEYTNSVNFKFTANSDEPEVHTGAINILKVDAANNAKVLPGAVFDVYRTATAEEVAAGGDQLLTLEGISGYVVKVSFYDNAAMIGSKVTSVTSGDNGEAAIYGLAYGTYYLVETAAPAGYNMPDGVITVTVDAGSHTEDRVIVIKNVSGTVLPQTGGIGTTAYVVGGMALMAISLLLILMKSRRYARSAK